MRAELKARRPLEWTSAVACLPWKRLWPGRCCGRTSWLQHGRRQVLVFPDWCLREVITQSAPPVCYLTPVSSLATTIDRLVLQAAQQSAECNAAEVDRLRCELGDASRRSAVVSADVRDCDRLTALLGCSCLL